MDVQGKLPSKSSKSKGSKKAPKPKANASAFKDSNKNKLGMGETLASSEDSNNSLQTKKPTLKQVYFKNISKLPRLYIYAGIVVLALGFSGIILAMMPEPKAVPTPVIQTAPKIEVVEEVLTNIDPLTGLPATDEEAARPVTAVMIENSLAARPQSGLADAGVVFEAIAESGITRFAALYQQKLPSEFGPIRSSRPYYVDWINSFDPSYAHVGGDVLGRQAIAKYISKDIDQYFRPGPYYRISERSAPHNMYSTGEGIDKLNASLNYTSSTYTAWPRKDDEPKETPDATKITMSISSASFNPIYTYNAETNAYGRSYASGDFIDANTGAQIQAKVVVAMQISGYGYLSDSDGPRWRYSNIGTGNAWVFQDGTVIKGKWSKPNATTQLKFTDAAGEEIKLNAGATWVSAVNKVSW